MSEKEKYKRYGYEDAYDTEKENDWTNRLNFDDCIEIMNNQFNKINKYKEEIQKLNVGIVHLKGQLKQTKQRLTEKEKKIKELSEEHFEMFGDIKNYKNLWLAEQRKNKDLHYLEEKNRLRDKPIIETNRETGTIKIDNIEFNVEQTKAICYLLEVFERKTCKQVCEEIREKIEDLIEVSFDNEEDEFSTITIWGLKKVLDQTEKGEEDE